MRHKNFSISRSAKDFIEKKNIENATFNLKVLKPKGGCCLSIAKDIEPVYEVANDPRLYNEFQVDGKRFFIAKEIRIVGPIKLVTEGFGYFKRLALSGVLIPI